MLGFPGEDYTTPPTIQETGGFGDPATRPERLERLQWALDRTRGPGALRPDAARRLPARAGRPGPQAVPRHAGQAGAARRRRRASRSPSRPARRPPTCSRRTLDDLESPEPEGELRPGQHAALRQGRPDPGRRDPRPRHPQRPRQGREPADRRRASGARRCRWARARSTSRGSCRPEEGRLPRPAVHRARGRRPGRADARRGPRPGVPQGVPGEADGRAEGGTSTKHGPSLLRRVVRSPDSRRFDRRADQPTTESTTWASSRPASVRP